MKRIIAVALLATFCCFNHFSSCHAAIILTANEIGTDVVISGSGRLNIDALNFGQTLGGAFAGIGPGVNSRLVRVGPDGGARQDTYTSISPPASIGPGAANFIEADSGSGDMFGAGLTTLTVPEDYVSNSFLSGSSTFENESFATLGIAPGIYDWTWGGGSNADFLRLKVGDVPEPSTCCLSLATLAAFVLRRKR